tara:strand:- start:663 stop:1712 length:1050 start_codon:yes stop_codon:yes gene_type:complete
MSDSTIDDALRLLEVGKGNVDRLKQIIETFETRSLVSIQDRKYVEALVQQYLTPRHRIRIKKIEPVKKEQTSIPRTLKSTKPEFAFEKDSEKSATSVKDEKSEFDVTNKKICLECGHENSDRNNFCEKCGSLIIKPEKITSSFVGLDAQSKISKENESDFEKYEREYLERQQGKKDESSNEAEVVSESVEYIEARPNKIKKTDKKLVGIAAGIIAVIIITGGAVLMTDDIDFSSTSKIEERITCDNKPLLVSTTKIPNFPNPEKDLQYYLDRYNNEPKYKDWFDRNFPDQTIQDVLVVKTSGSNPTKIPNFPDPEKDLQYYLDRYNNEPKYKDWFDRNFPDQTIQDVIC